MVHELLNWFYSTVQTDTNKCTVVQCRPCHGHFVERSVKKVSEGSLQVAGFEKRDGWIRAADDSRKKLPRMETKKYYKLLLLGT